MNYAKKTSEAQINYVVGLWRLKQVLTKHKQIHGKDKQKKPYQFRLVEPGLVLTPGVNALYLLSKGSQTCKSGPLISSIQPNSPFKDAKPSIPQNSFLVTVDGVKLDKYGQGIKKEYVDEMVDFSDLMWMRSGTGEEDISFETCNAATGKIQKHTMSMAWSKDRQGKGIQYVYEPRLDKVEWEVFGELIFMQLTENHIALFNGDFHSSAMIRFLDPEQRSKPRLAVMLLKGGGEAQDALDIVERINGHKVKDLEDYRQHFFPDPLQNQNAKAPSGLKLISANASRHWPQGITADPDSIPGSQSFLRKQQKAVRDGEELVWSLKTASGKEYASLFMQTLTSQATQYAQGYSYVMTIAAKDAMTQLGFFKERKKKSLLATPPDVVDDSVDIDATDRFDSQPLQVVRREGNVEILDFALHESIDSW